MAFKSQAHNVTGLPAAGSFARVGLASAIAVCGIAVHANAQSNSRDFTTYQPSVSPARVDKADAPKIDGIVDPAEWGGATVLSEFYQVEPSVGPAKVETQVYLAFSEDALYVAVKAFDDEPENIRATVLQQDGDVWRDDMLRFYIDPFDTGISGFGFDVNSLGARGSNCTGQSSSNR